MPTVLIVGGYGAFGGRAAERLARDADLEIVIAGRHIDRAATAATSLAATPQVRARISHAACDARTLTAADLATIAPHVIINASGPFQAQDYTVARAAIEARCHYLDLADARGFVTGISALDTAARNAGCLVVSGASSVPGLSSAIVRELAPRLANTTSLDIGISPGNSFDPGLATTQSILGYVGRPLRMLIDGAWQDAHGWQGTRRHSFPQIGTRWLGYGDVPDLDLFPKHYPTLTTMRFHAGVEVAMFHFGVWLISWGVRAGRVRNPSALAGPLLSMKRKLAMLGSDRGGMYVALAGTDHGGCPRRLVFELEAGSGHGPYIPAMASTILARKLCRGELTATGAMPCFDLFTLADFDAAVADLDIRHAVREETT